MLLLLLLLLLVQSSPLFSLPPPSAPAITLSCDLPGHSFPSYARLLSSLWPGPLSLSVLLRTRDDVLSYAVHKGRSLLPPRVVLSGHLVDDLGIDSAKYPLALMRDLAVNGTEAALLGGEAGLPSRGLFEAVREAWGRVWAQDAANFTLVEVPCYEVDAPSFLDLPVDREALERLRRSGVGVGPCARLRPVVTLTACSPPHDHREFETEDGLHLHRDVLLSAMQFKRVLITDPQAFFVVPRGGHASPSPQAEELMDEDRDSLVLYQAGPEDRPGAPTPINLNVFRYQAKSDPFRSGPRCARPSWAWREPLGPLGPRGRDLLHSLSVLSAWLCVYYLSTLWWFESWTSCLPPSLASMIPSLKTQERDHQHTI